MPFTSLRSLLVVLAATLGLFFTEAQAMYARMSDAQLIAASDLIVLGTLSGSAKKSGADGKQQLVGLLKVTKTLKGGKAAGTIWLAVPQPNGLQSSSDITFSQSQNGLWFLRRLPGAGHPIYAADHPQRFVPQPQAEETARAVLDARD